MVESLERKLITFGLKDLAMLALGVKHDTTPNALISCFSVLNRGIASGVLTPLRRN